jgi:HD-like signal output (HDOD) protein
MNQAYVPAFTLEPEKKVAAPPPDNGPRTPNFINDIAAGRVELPTIPRVVQRLIAALRDPDVGARKIGAALSQDPVLSAKVLRLANSSFFGGQRSMASIDAAVAMIGTEALNRLLVACGISSSFKEIPGIDLPTFWRDALLVATAAHKLAPRLAADPEEAYVCGLLHATGHLILCQTYPDIANFVFTGFAVVRGAELAALELENFGIDHPTVGAIWIETIGFPQPVADAIRNAAQPLADTAGPLDLALRGACSLVMAVARKDTAEGALAALPPHVLARFAGADGKPDAAFDKLYEALQETEPSF